MEELHRNPTVEPPPRTRGQNGRSSAKDSMLERFRYGTPGGDELNPERVSAGAARRILHFILHRY